MYWSSSNGQGQGHGQDWYDYSQYLPYDHDPYGEYAPTDAYWHHDYEIPQPKRMVGPDAHTSGTRFAVSLAEFQPPTRDYRWVKSRRDKHDNAPYTHQQVPRNINFEDKYGDAQSEEITTLMIRNIPNRYTQKMLMEELDELGLAGLYDFFYLPRDRRNGTNVGYAFVNWESGDAAKKCQDSFIHYRFKRIKSGKIGQVSIAHIQGLRNICEHYSNTAVSDWRHQHGPILLHPSAPSQSTQTSLSEEHEDSGSDSGESVEQVIDAPMLSSLLVAS